MKILVLQLAKMGDLLQTAPLLQRLREIYPQAELHLLHSEMFSAAAARLDVDVHRAVNLDELNVRHLTAALRDQWFDLVVNPSSNRLAEQLAAGCNAPVLGYGGEDADSLVWLRFALSFVRSRRLQTLNLVDIYRQLCPMPLEASNPQWRPDWPSYGLVGFQLASRNRKRQWPPAQFAQLARMLQEHGTRVRLFGVQSEAPLTEEMLGHMGDVSGVENLVGKTGIDDVFRAVEECDALVTGDTGVMHVATMVNTPVAAVFLGPASPWETLAWSDRSLALWPDSNHMPCWPCQEVDACPHHLACHETVRAEDVLHLQERTGLRVALSARDALGQRLAPFGQWRDDEIVGLYYRAWAGAYFLGEEIAAPQLSDELCAQIQRELLLWEKLRPQQLSPEKIAPSFALLTPLVWFTQLCRELCCEAPASLEAHLRTQVGLTV